MSERALVDTHCHLVLPEMAADLPQVILRARQSGVRSIVVPGVDVATSRNAVRLAETTPGVYAAVGLHPHFAAGWSAGVRADLRALAASPHVVAIGEIGLDYYRNLAPKEAQARAFRDLLELAGEMHRPVIVHSREALADVLAAIEGWAAQLAGRNGRPTGVLHAFAGGLAEAQLAQERGLMLGVAGPITYPKSHRLRQVVSGVQLANLVVETDSPYMAPAPHRGRRNEPAHVSLVAAGLAQALSLEAGQVAAATTQNAARLFGWMDEHTNRNLL